MQDRERRMRKARPEAWGVGFLMRRFGWVGDVFVGV